MFDLSTANGRYLARKAGLQVPKQKRGPRPADPWERFSRLYVVEGECWLWRGAKDPKGYGRFHCGGGGRAVLAHRFAYERANGAVPAGLELDHLCRVPSCVNPAHLEPVTGQVNVLRSGSPSALNARKTHCPKGHAYTPENTQWFKNHRSCKACSREHDRLRPSGWERSRAASGSRDRFRP